MRGMNGVRVEMDIYKGIRQKFIDGESQRHTTKRLGISRQTVKKYCEGSAHPDVCKTNERPLDTITDEVKQFKEIH